MTLLHLFLILAGPLTGSFVGLLAFRWGTDEPWIATRSACRSCGKPLHWSELLPLVSFILQRGRCRQCKTPISWLHPVCELGGLAVALSAFAFAPPGTFILSCLFGWTLLTLAAIDWRSYILPDALNLLAALLGVLMIWTTERADWAEHVIGGVAGYLLLLSVELFYRHVRGRDGLGRGDAKLLGALGLWVGWTRLPDILLVGSVSALIAALVLSRRSGERLSGSTAMAFGPWLALGGWVCWLSGPLLVPQM